jgi:hypothetical protein
MIQTTIIKLNDTTFVNSANAPLAGSKLYILGINSNEKVVCYSDSQGTRRIAQPIELDAKGSATVYTALGTRYKTVVFNNTETLIQDARSPSVNTTTTNSTSTSLSGESYTASTYLTNWNSAVVFNTTEDACKVKLPKTSIQGAQLVIQNKSNFSSIIIEPDSANLMVPPTRPQFIELCPGQFTQLVVGADGNIIVVAEPKIGVCLENIENNTTLDTLVLGSSTIFKFCQTTDNVIVNLSTPANASAPKVYTFSNINSKDCSIYISFDNQIINLKANTARQLLWYEHWILIN